MYYDHILLPYRLSDNVIQYEGRRENTDRPPGLRNGLTNEGGQYKQVAIDGERNKANLLLRGLIQNQKKCRSDWKGKKKTQPISIAQFRLVIMDALSIIPPRKGA